MEFPYKHVLVIGATSGIGKSLADRLIKAGSKVISVGRRIDRLDDFVARHGQNKAAAFPFDINKREEIPKFAAHIMEAYPDIDCVFLNAGVQYRHDFSHPEKVDLGQFDFEINVNFLSFVALTHAFLPFLMKKKSQTGLIFTGSNLAIIPAAVLPGYSASKAALNAFVLCLREQLRNTNVKVIEISPPPVQTELHDAHMGEEAGRKLGMPLETFTELAFTELATGNDQVVIGSIGPSETFNEIIDKRRTACSELARLMQERG